VDLSSAVQSGIFAVPGDYSLQIEGKEDFKVHNGSHADERVITPGISYY
jgi:hypothetical protein